MRLWPDRANPSKAGRKSPGLLIFWIALLNFYSRQHAIELSQSPNLRQKPDILVFELLLGHHEHNTLHTN